MELSFKSSLSGLKIVSFENRCGQEMADLIRNQGAEPSVAPSMREIPLGENRAAMDLIGQIEGGKDWYLSGPGIRV
jgi:hypothetical protein